MIMNDIVHVALAANHVYMPGLRATLVSLINASNDKQCIQVHILSDGLYESDIEELKIIANNLGLELPIDFRHPDMRLIAKHFKPYKDSYTTFLRLFFTDFFPELDWIIWSDADVLWFRDPRDLWNLKDDSIAIQWGREQPAGQIRAKKYFETFHSGFDKSRYCCAGILLMNLRRLRELGICAKSIAFVEKWGCPPLCDQDLLNELCYDDARIIDNIWGCYNPSLKLKDGVVLHCSGISLFFKDLTYNGKWPMWALWFEYYNQVVLGKKDYTACAFGVRVFFTLASFIYVPMYAFGFFAWALSPTKADVLRLGLYYAWFMRRRLWSVGK